MSVIEPVTMSNETREVFEMYVSTECEFLSYVIV